MALGVWLKSTARRRTAVDFPCNRSGELCLETSPDEELKENLFYSPNTVWSKSAVNVGISKMRLIWHKHFRPLCGCS